MKYKGRISPSGIDVIVEIMYNKEDAATVVRHKFFYRGYKWFKQETEEDQWKRAQKWLDEQLERFNRFEAGEDITK